MVLPQQGELIMAFSVKLKLSVGTLQLLDQQRKRTRNSHDAIISKALQQLIKSTTNHEVINLDPEKPGNLRHTGVQSVKIDGGDPIENPTCFFVYLCFNVRNSLCLDRMSKVFLRNLS